MLNLTDITSPPCLDLSSPLPLLLVSDRGGIGPIEPFRLVGLLLFDFVVFVCRSLFRSVVVFVSHFQY